MKNICKIYIVRHGESVANRDEVCGGDSDLTEKGRAQAQETKTLLAGVHFDAAYSSDLVRAVDTASIIYGQPVPVENQLDALRERDFGRLENQPNVEWVDIKDAYDEKYSSLPFQERYQHEYADFIEGDKALCDRYLAALKEVALSRMSQTILVASHAGPIRVILMKLGYADFLTMGSFKNAGYVELSYDGHDFAIEEVVGIQDPASAA